MDASELSGRQKALFGCIGANLTLRDCTITVINPTDATFTLVRQEPASRPSRIWLERTLVRGGLITLAELAGGPADVVLDGTTVLTAGAGPPVVRVTRPEPRPVSASSSSGALLASPGPVVQCDPAGESAARPVAWPSAPTSRRSAGSRGRGPRAFVAWSDPGARRPSAQVDWAGDRNLFAGWRGFFARGRSRTITVFTLAAVRSTWNAIGAGGPGDPADLAALRRPGAVDRPPSWTGSSPTGDT